MNPRLNKILIEYWWLPILLFLIACGLYALPIFETDNPFLKGFYIILLWLTGIYLTCSFFYNLAKRKYAKGSLQFILGLPLIVWIGLIFFLRLLKEPTIDWGKSQMTDLIEEKSDLKITEDFSIITDKAEHTEGAFDSDYSYNLTIKYYQSQQENIIEQITNSVLFDTINSTNYADPKWKIINSKTDKGIWTYYKNGFEFLHCSNERNRPEPFYLTVDTITRIIELNLQHL